jgi:hypothetical protein
MDIGFIEQHRLTMKVSEIRENFDDQKPQKKDTDPSTVGNNSSRKSKFTEKR